MGEFSISLKTRLAAWISALIIIGLNVKLVVEEIAEWTKGTDHPVLFALTVYPIAILTGCLLIYIIIKPFLTKGQYTGYKPHEQRKALTTLPEVKYKHIAIAVDFSESDNLSISHALSQGGPEANYLLIHITETPGAFVMGKETKDLESATDLQSLNEYSNSLKQRGYAVNIQRGFGNPKRAIPKIVKEHHCDLLVMGAHGHTGFKDLILGTTVDTVRHRVNIPVLIVHPA
jgi:manganese transport protein